MRVVAKIENEVCPQYRELSSDRLLAQFEEDEEVQRYLPDENEKGHRVPRTYLVQILFVLRGDYMRRIVNHAIDIRHQTRGFRDGVQPIQLHPAVLEMLTDRVFLSSKSKIPIIITFICSREARQGKHCLQRQAHRSSCPPGQTSSCFGCRLQGLHQTVKRSSPLAPPTAPPAKGFCPSSTFYATV